MNIFALSSSPRSSAQMMCDKHVVKMILESAQICCTVHWKHRRLGVDYDIPYKPTHANHPCTLWAAKSISNYTWLVNHARALNDEYKFRYNRSVDHKSWTVIQSLPSPNIPLIPLTPFAQAMPDKYKNPSDPHAAYMTYYINEKHDILKYTNREVPAFIKLVYPNVQTLRLEPKGLYARGV